MVAPKLSAMIGAKNDGNYTQAFMIGFGLALVGVALTFVYKAMRKAI